MYSTKKLYYVSKYCGIWANREKEKNQNIHRLNLLAIYTQMYKKKKHETQQQMLTVSIN